MIESLWCGKQAAQSLAMFKLFSDAAVGHLLVALQDKDSGTRMMALDTLLNYSARTNMDVQRAPKLLIKLQHVLKVEGLQQDVNSELYSFVDAQKPVNNALFFNVSPQQ